MSDLLSGIRVLESSVLLSDAAGMMVADMGAEVIKIESPGGGDYLRDMLCQITPHNSPAHLQVNKNKRSMTLDVRKPEGLAVFHELLATADVFISGFLTKACKRLKIDYDSLRAVKPDLVYAQYTGFGGHGPYASIPTHGQMMGSLAGSFPVAMDPDGIVRARADKGFFGGPASGGEATAAGASYVAANIAAGLVHRLRTGEGCYIDGAGADGVIYAGWIGSVYGFNLDRITDWQGMRDEGDSDRPPERGAKYQFYRTSDGKYALFAAQEQKFWANFCRAVDREDLLSSVDETMPVDFGRLEGLQEALTEIMAQRTLAEWLQLAIDADVPIGPAHDVADVVTDPQIRSREIVAEGEHPVAGPFTYVGSPVVVQGQPYSVRHHAPALGEQTDEILGELGYGPERIAELRANGIV